jgi:gliding motility-associated-like protein
VAYAHWDPPTASVTCGEIVLTGSHQPGDAFSVGTTQIEYAATDGAGNAAYCRFNVVITDPEIQIGVNQLVTPDGDGINDAWTIANIEKFKDNEVLLVDRWGGVIFLAKGYDNQDVLWRGANQNGQLVPTGTYFYSITVKHRSSKLDKKGFIEVVR